MSEEQASPMSPMNYMKIFFRRKEFLIVPAYVGLILGICMCFILPKQYMSSTILLLEEGKSDNPLFEDLAVSTTIEQRMTAIKESMLGWNNLVTLVKRLNMDKNIKTPKEFEALIMGIRRNMMINLRGNNIIMVSYLSDTPELTRDVVKATTEIFIERNVNTQTQETDDAVSFIEAQLKLYKGRIKSSELAQMKDQLKLLLQDSTERHPLVKQLREQITVKEDEIRQENLEYTENVSLDATTTNPIIDEIKKALDTIEGGSSVSLTSASGNPEKEYYRIMLMDKLDNAMARDVNVNTNIYNMLLQRLETAKITRRLQASKEGTKYTVLDPPRIPLDAKKPNKPLVTLMGLLLGLVTGVGLIFVLEFLDQSFIDVEETKEFLGVPLLGAISRISTVDGNRHEKEQMAWMYGLTFTGGILLVVMTAGVMNFIK